MLRFTIKNLLARKFRLVTTGSAVLIGVAFMAGGLVLSDTIGRAFDNLFAKLGEETDAVVRSSDTVDSDFGEVRGRIDASIIDTVRDVDGVDKVAPSIASFRAQIINPEGEEVGPSAGAGPPTIGDVWNGDDELSGGRVVDGRAPASDDEVVIDRASAEDGDIEVGETITVSTKVGVLPYEVVGLIGFEQLNSIGGASFVGFTFDAAQEVLGEAGKVDSVAVSAEDGVSQDELRDRLAEVVPAGVEVVTGQTVVEENQDAIGDNFGFFDILVNVFAGIALFVGSFIIYNTFSILVAQRTREMALLRAIGASRRQVLGALLAEAVVVGLLASLLGLLGGLGLAALLLNVLESVGFELPSQGYVLTSATVVTTVVVGVGVTVVAAVFPAWRGASVPPLAAMRDVALEDRGSSRIRLGLGTLVTVGGVALVLAGLFGADVVQTGFGVALVFLGVAALGPVFARPMVAFLGWPVARYRGVTGRLARENAMRNPKRTSRTAAALLIGVALVGTITIVASSVKASFKDIFEDQFTSDFVVSAGQFGAGGVSPQLAGELADRPELDTVAPLRFAPGTFDGEDGLIAAIGSEAVGDLFDIGVVAGDADDLDDDGLAVLREKAEDEGWELGTRVPVKFPGTAEFEATVALIYTKDEVTGAYFFGLPAFDAHVADNYDSTIYVSVADGVDFDDARAAIEEVSEPYPSISVEDREEFVETNLSSINIVLNIIYALLFLSVLIALLGITNTLALSIVERTRELGLLRAVGMTRRQMRGSVRWEAVLIALFGTIGGLGVGVFFGWAIFKALEEEGFKIFAVPFGQLFVIAVIGSVAGVLAALLPARRAARLDILTAIASD
ncbi:MAG: ABC transporter permease [Acidimicrobiia bacterium]